MRIPLIYLGILSSPRVFYHNHFDYSYISGTIESPYLEGNSAILPDAINNYTLGPEILFAGHRFVSINIHELAPSSVCLIYEGKGLRRAHRTWASSAFLIAFGLLCSM